MSAHYEQVNMLLLNEFLKSTAESRNKTRKVQQLEETAAQQKHDLDARIAQQQKQIEALTVGLQKVSGQLQLSKPASQLVANDH